MPFNDRFLKCSDCGNDFVFTAGEQIFFEDRQFKNDPKRCKLCKAKRAGLGRASASGSGLALPFSRTETRTECSACGIETTVPFKPTQGRPVLCRSCFQMKRVPSGVAAVAAMDSPEAQVAALESALASAATPSFAVHSPSGHSQSGHSQAGHSQAEISMEMIADAPAAVLAGDVAESMVAAALDAPQA